MDARELRGCPSCGALPCDWTDDLYAKASRSKMDAREVIADYLRGAKQFSPTTETNMALEIIHALAAANIDLVHRDENHEPTRDRAAEIAASNYGGHGSELGTARSMNYEHAGKVIAASIRAMEVK